MSSVDIVQLLSEKLTGEIYSSSVMKTLYATDASAYREIPHCIVIPKNNNDIKKIIELAYKYKFPLIPRAAGTSLAGQVVGNGVVVDISQNFTKILEVNEEEQWVRVEPGVVRDDLNAHLKPYGLFFGPETSTANRAMIGGMVGNNSCGANSLVYGSTRDHLLSVKGFLCDGTETEFTNITREDFNLYCEGKKGSLLEQQIYRSIFDELSSVEVQKRIEKEFPKKEIHRRNTGYAIDLLAEMEPFTGNSDRKFNFCELLAGSEGTLFFTTEIKISLDPLPPKEIGLLCVHCNTLDESLRANIVALQSKPFAVELMDHYILECTKENREHVKNRFFLDGDPAAVLIVELRGDTQEELQHKSNTLITALQEKKLGYHYPLVTGTDTKRVWALRKAGLGLLSNIPGDAKPVPVIEDTAVTVEDLPMYIEEFNKTLQKYKLSCVHYAHAGSGELHLRPILDLKTEEGNKLFRIIAYEIAQLVKKYGGSLSGEHGDGRLRGEFIPFMIGKENYEIVKHVKKVWDPHNIFNPQKIVDTPSMNSSLRYEPGQGTPNVETVFDFSDSDGFIRAAEKCNGSGDCRKTPVSGGTMCPSYMATRNEKDTTRARANILRELINRDGDMTSQNIGDIKEVLDLCLSCKGCKTECPSNVDMAKLKAEVTHKYHQLEKIPLRSRLFSHITHINNIASKVPSLHNAVMKNSILSSIIKKSIGISSKRDLPLLDKITFRSWFNRYKKEQSAHTKKVYLFCDEFTNFSETENAKKCVKLLNRLGYEILVIDHEESGRTYLSKGLLQNAKRIAEKNISIFSTLISDETPLVGIEPSAILTFRDEYIDFFTGDMKKKARKLSENCLTVEEFLSRELKNDRIDKSLFHKKSQKIKLHGHCHQKALSSVQYSKDILSIPENYSVEIIPSGCCGMAGSFGFEKEHYEVSLSIGELALFPSIRESSEDTIIAAAGTSCRHQIKDGTSRVAKHPIEVLFDALA